MKKTAILKIEEEKPKRALLDWGVIVLLGIYVLLLIIFRPSEKSWIDIIGILAWALLLINTFIKKK